MEYALKAVLDFIIPEIAITMIEKSYFFITEDMMYSVVNQYFERLKNLKRQQVWTRVYYGYQDDIRAIFEGVGKRDMWTSSDIFWGFSRGIYNSCVQRMERIFLLISISEIILQHVR